MTQTQETAMSINREEREHLATMVVQIMDDWNLEPSVQVALLGLPAKTRPRELLRLRRGTAVPDEDAVLERCQHILRIHHALELLFAKNPALQPAWITDPGNRNFDCSPLQVMVEGGIDGMRRVSRLLECRDDWD